MVAVVEVTTLVTVVLATVTGVLVLRQRHVSSLARALALSMFGAAWWAAARAALPLVATSYTGTAALQYGAFVGISLSFTAIFSYYLALSGRVVTRRTVALLCIEPALLALAAATDGWHRGFLRLSVRDGAVVTHEVGPVYWLHTAYAYGLLLVGVVLALRAMARAVPGHRQVLGIAALAATLPLVGNVLANVLSARTGQSLYLTPGFVILSTGIWLWLERYRNHTRAVLVSTRQVLAAMTDAVVVVDPRGVVLDANVAATRLVAENSGPDAAERLVGSRWTGPVDLEEALAAEAVTRTTPSGRALDVRVTQITDPAGRPASTVVVLRDVTELERLRAELADQALRDGLTGVHNRRSFEQRLAAALDRSREDGTPLSVVLVDLDHFKAVNDTHGHAVGDRLLVAVAHALDAAGRPGETVARFGGEEFVVLLPGVTGHDAYARAEDLRRRCAETRVPVRDGGEVGATLSVGVAELPADGTADEVLRAADRALYAAKSAGRDRVVHAGVPRPTTSPEDAPQAR